MPLRALHRHYPVAEEPHLPLSVHVGRFVAVLLATTAIMGTLFLLGTDSLARATASAASAMQNTQPY